MGCASNVSGDGCAGAIRPGGLVHPYVMLIENVSGDPIYMPVKIVPLPTG